MYAYGILYATFASCLGRLSNFYFYSDFYAHFLADDEQEKKMVGMKYNLKIIPIFFGGWGYLGLVLRGNCPIQCKSL